MRADVSLALRGAWPKALRALASWRLSVVLMVTVAFFYAQLAVFARGSPSEVVQNIAALLPFWAVYVLLLVNTAACLWVRLPTLRRDLEASPHLTLAPPSWEVPAPADEAAARAALRRLGYQVHALGEGRLWGLKHRWAALGTYLFHGAFFVLAAGFGTTLAFREEYRIVAALGEDYVGAPEQVLAREGTPIITLGPPAVRFTHERLEPAFWQDQLLFTRLSSTVRLPNGAPVDLEINRPLWLGFGTFLRLTGFGYAPRYELRTREGPGVQGAFLKLKVFPPGQQDSFQLEGLPHRVYLQVFPDLLETPGRGPDTRSLNLVNPGFLVRVLRGRVDLGEQLLRGHDEAIAFEGFLLRFPEVSTWGEFKVLRDPGAPILLLGFVMGLVGLVLKLRGRRAEAEWTAERAVLRGWGAPVPQDDEGRSR